VTVLLGIETSCDETAAAVVTAGENGVPVVRSSIVASQHDTHAPFGGVVPELAARAHVERIDVVVLAALDDAGVGVADLDGVAVTAGPGLAGALHVGVAAAKGICVATGLPLFGVHHLVAHLWANRIADPDLRTPAVALLVSGGHTLLLHVHGDDGADGDDGDVPLGDLRVAVLGGTVDDAVGEAYDKVARMMGLGYPGGPVIDRLAADGDPDAVALPRAMRHDGVDFSFSGLKTAVVQAVRRADAAGTPIAPQDLAASFQAAVVDVLVDKTMRAVRDTGVDQVAVGGGVAANSALRRHITDACDAAGVRVAVPPPALCGDNAAMIAAAAVGRARRGDADPLDLPVRPTWPLPAAPGAAR
jgi:N6-L-threonylcarbamoyladenine synthase